MRRILLTSLVLLASAAGLAALPTAGDATTPLTLTKVRADWFSHTHRIFINTTWAPKSYTTTVTVKITVNGNSVRTLRATNWVIGHKLFQLTMPATIARGSKARIEVRVHSKAGDDHRAVSLYLV